MRDHEVILDLLGRVARRLWAERALQEIGFGLSLVLFSLLAYRLVQPALGATPGGAVSVAGLSAVLGAGLACVAWRAGLRTTLAQAAAAVDARARLKDEIKTAYWLCAQGETSALAQLQIARAARTVARLDARRLAPARAPRSWWIAGLLAAALSATGFIVAPVSHSWGIDAAPGASGTGASGSLRALLDGAPREAAIEKLERALATLEADNAPLQERQHALAQAREAQEEIDMRAVAAREAMSQLALAMATREALQPVARALRDGRTGEALDLLQRTAGEERAGGAGAAAPSGQLQENGALEFSTERASRELRNRNLELNEDTLNRVLRNIRDAQAVLETQNRVNEVRRQMEGLVAGSQRSPLTAGRFDRRAATPNPTPAPETGGADLQAGTLFRQGAIAREDRQDDAREGSISGAAEGHGEALAVEGEKSARLDARLKLETMQGGEDRPGEVLAQAPWYHAATQSAAAQTAFAEVRGRPRFSRAGVMSVESVPLRERQLVKDYFINLHESEQ
ncbi:MAG TPA: hypothetical protein VNM24_02605 [Burkholderiales bacterium]|nr:hypothetical protein [Burkholderiales bacterium]